MAKKVVLIDDVTGDVIDEDLGGRSIEFSVDGTHYTLDLGVKSLELFNKDLSKWVDAAIEVEAPRRTSSATSAKRRGAPVGGSGRSKEELINIREWLKKNDHEVSGRGRIKADLLALYDEANVT